MQHNKTFSSTVFIPFLALPDGSQAEIDLRLYKNAENETKMITENKLVFYDCSIRMFCVIFTYRLWDFITARENSNPLVSDEWNH